MISGNLGHIQGVNILWTMYFMETLLLSAPRTILLMWHVHNTWKKGKFNWLTENFLKLGCELIHHWSSNQQSLRGTATSRRSLTKPIPVTARIFNFDSIIREETWVRGLGEGSEIGRPVIMQPDMEMYGGCFSESTNAGVLVTWQSNNTIDSPYDARRTQFPSYRD